MFLLFSPFTIYTFPFFSGNQPALDVDALIRQHSKGCPPPETGPSGKLRPRLVDSSGAPPMPRWWWRPRARTCRAPCGPGDEDAGTHCARKSVRSV